MTKSREIAVIGGGPRGLSIVERLIANSSPVDTSRLHIHLIDPTAAGSGSVWRPDQSPFLLTNTVAGQITVFSDSSSIIEGPILPGPSLYEWAADLPDDDPVHQPTRLSENCYPTRASFGRYLSAALERILKAAPEYIEVTLYRARVVALADTDGFVGGPQGVRLDDGTRLHGLDAVILALGHLPLQPDPRQARTASLARIHNLLYIPPSNPADVDLEDVASGSTVLMRGLGLNFFDYMTLLSQGRGGKFERDDKRILRYHASGQEPRMVASSRRGIPFHARGENQKGVDGRHYPHVVTADRMLSLSRPINFDRDLWPLIDREVQLVFYAALLRERGGDGDALAHQLAVLEDLHERESLLDAANIESEARWSWSSVEGLRRRDFVDRNDFRVSMIEHLRADVAEARRGNVGSPVKAALDALRDLRNEIRLAVDHGGLGVTQARLDQWFTPLNAFLSVGPPASRIEQMAALMEIGLVVLTGPDTWIRLDSNRPAFISASSSIPGPVIEGATLIECRLPEADIRRCTEPLVRHLLATEQATNFSVVEEAGIYPTGGLAVTKAPFHLISAHGETHPRRFAYGVPTEGVHWVTAAGARPGVDSVMIKDADAIARAALLLGPPKRAGAGASIAGAPV